MDYQQVFKTSNQGVVDIRRDLHRHPELAFLEYRTAAKVAAYLDGLGYAVKVGPQVMAADAIFAPPSAETIAQAQATAIAEGAPAEWVARMPGGQTGVVAELRRGAGPVVAFRFDMDALPVRETGAASHLPGQGGYGSTHPGRMHACGHDGHVAIGLATASRLLEGEDWQGTLRLIFQPAEEGGRGALPMVEAGVVDDVDYFFVAHLGCLLPTGKVAMEATGFLWAAGLDVTIHGQAAHAAMGPQDGSNALLAGATATLGLYGISRHGESHTLVNVGQMTAGTARNIIADRCDLVIDLRSDTKAGYDYMRRRAEEVIAAAAAMHGCTAQTQALVKGEGNQNSSAIAEIVGRVAARTEGTTEVVKGWPIGGGDDATRMIKRVQERGKVGGYFLIGSDIAAIHHAKDFDIDEASLDHGVRLFAGIAREVLGRR